MRDAKTLHLALQNREVLRHYSSFFFRRFDADKSGNLSLSELERLIPQLHFELGLSEVPGFGQDVGQRVRARMRKFDRNNDGVLSEAEFIELYRWSLWRKYEDVNPPIFRRGDIIGKSHAGVPVTFYEIGAELGAGAFGVVHLVKHRSTGLQRVLKTVNKDKAIQGGSPVAEIQQEIDLLAMLDHPNVLKLYEWFNDTVNIYIITDECAGGDLVDLLKQSAERQWALPGPWVAKIFRQSLEAIGYCHGKGVMHKDLKFENIMLQNQVTPSSQIDEVVAVVIDVGLAELFGVQHGKENRSKQRSGSLATMAPEVIQGDFSYKCDIWSMGCMLFAVYNTAPFYIPDGKGGQMLYMYPFFPKVTDRDRMGLEGLLASQEAGPPMQLIQSGGPPLVALISNMLQFNEAGRPSAQQCLMSPWFAQTTDERNSAPTLQFAKEHLENLLGDRNRSLVWRAATVQAALQLPGAKIEPMAKLFRSMDEDMDGLVDKQELCNGLATLGVSPDAAAAAADAADFDGNGKIEWTEFVASCLPAARELFAISLQAAFSAVDRDCDGSIDKEELQQMLSGGQVDLPTTKSVETMLAELDFNRDERISFCEFQDYYLHADAGL